MSDSLKSDAFAKHIAELQARPCAKMTQAELERSLTQQGFDSVLDHAYVCPRCGTVQSARDFLAAGLDNFEAIKTYVGRKCIGGFMPMERRPRAKFSGGTCQWTTDSFQYLRMHELEVVTDEGLLEPRFLPATPEQARAHAKQFNVDGKKE